MNINLLKSKMALYGDKNYNLADVLGITPASISAKLTGRFKFTLSEIEKIVNHYSLNKADTFDIFFNSNSLVETNANKERGHQQ
ncbi:MAG: DUF739 domain-containing protein [Oscillospiraceae bacterium]|jgi:antitoxin component HigA of HigAB toxin-antitoxin module|nr:DUF739 domain-containing protein [Oscillospiraceae bacterium]